MGSGPYGMYGMFYIFPHLSYVLSPYYVPDLSCPVVFIPGRGKYPPTQFAVSSDPFAALCDEILSLHTLRICLTPLRHKAIIMLDKK